MVPAVTEKSLPISSKLADILLQGGSMIGNFPVPFPGKISVHFTRKDRSRSVLVKTVPENAFSDRFRQPATAFLS